MPVKSEAVQPLNTTDPLVLPSPGADPRLMLLNPEQLVLSYRATTKLQDHGLYDLYAGWSNTNPVRSVSSYVNIAGHEELCTEGRIFHTDSTAVFKFLNDDVLAPRARAHFLAVVGEEVQETADLMSHFARSYIIAKNSVNDPKRRSIKAFNERLRDGLHSTLNLYRPLSVRYQSFIHELLSSDLESFIGQSLVYLREQTTARMAFTGIKHAPELAAEISVAISCLEIEAATNSIMQALAQAKL